MNKITTNHLCEEKQTENYRNLYFFNMINIELKQTIEEL